MYPVYCSWCSREGKITIVNYSKVKGTHGICKNCLKKQLKELEEYDKIQKEIKENEIMDK